MRERFSVVLAFDGKPLEVRISTPFKDEFDKQLKVAIGAEIYGIYSTGYVFFNKNGKVSKYKALDRFTLSFYSVPRSRMTQDTVEFFQSCVAAALNHKSAEARA